eukprot:1799999-Amphidinium_carterae.2
MHMMQVAAEEETGGHFKEALLIASIPPPCPPNLESVTSWGGTVRSFGLRGVSACRSTRTCSSASLSCIHRELDMNPAVR